MSRRINFNDEQLALPFGESRAGSISLPISLSGVSLEARQRIFWTLMGISIFSLFIYFYAVSAIARNTALRQNLEAHMADASGRIATLEFAHIELENSVTEELARQYGFEEVKAPLYVSRTKATELTLNTR